MEMNKLNEQAQEAFIRIMGDPTMPQDATAEYDEWLFNKTWEAAIAALQQQPASQDLEGENKRLREALGTTRSGLWYALVMEDDEQERRRKLNSLLEYTQQALFKADKLLGE